MPTRSQSQRVDIFFGVAMRRFPLVLPLLLLVSISCSRKGDGHAELVTFPLRGRIVAIDTMSATLTVAHEAIPNYMNSMIMPFKVHDRTLLTPLAPGDSIHATLAVSRMESWLEGIAVTGKGSPERTLTPDDILLAKLFKPGDILPDDSWMNQDGREIRFSQFHGKAIAVTFIYTRCPLPDFCIRMSTHFAALQKALENDPSMNSRWHLLSISFDAKFDRPPVLKRYAESYGADAAAWDFLTDPDTSGERVRRIADGLGLQYANDEGLIAHNLRTVILDGEGKLVSLTKGNEWTPGEMAQKIKDATR